MVSAAGDGKMLRDAPLRHLGVCAQFVSRVAPLPLPPRVRAPARSGFGLALQLGRGGGQDSNKIRAVQSAGGAAV